MGVRQEADSNFICETSLFIDSIFFRMPQTPRFRTIQVPTLRCTTHSFTILASNAESEVADW